MNLLMADAQFCSRCGLRLSRPDTLLTPAVDADLADDPVPIESPDPVEPFDFQALVSRGEAFDAPETGTSSLASGNVFNEAEPTFLGYDRKVESGIEGKPPATLTFTKVERGHESAPLTSGASEIGGQSSTSSAPWQTKPLASTVAVTPQGAIDLLPQEEVIQQLGALYLTNKRVILLDSNVIRSAFVRDIDAVGTMTERAPFWQALAGGALIGVAAGAVYAGIAGEALQARIGWAYILSPFISAALLSALGIFLLARFFLWIKRSLFVSVKGRPLITVSMTDWKASQLVGMDTFVNSFFQVKDFLSGDLTERQIE